MDHTHHMPAWAGTATPESGEALTAANGQGFRGQGTTDSADCANADAERKRFAGLAAEAALARCALHRLADGRYLLTRTGWGLCRELGTLQDVAKLLRTMRGQHEA